MAIEVILVNRQVKIRPSSSGRLLPVNVSVELMHGPDMVCSSVAFTPLTSKLGVTGPAKLVVAITNSMRMCIIYSDKFVLVQW